MVNGVLVVMLLAWMMSNKSLPLNKRHAINMRGVNDDDFTEKELRGLRSAVLRLLYATSDACRYAL